MPTAPVDRASSVGGSAVRRILLGVCVVLLLLARPGATYQQVSDRVLRGIPRPRHDEFDIRQGSILAPILRPRVPGTPGSAAVLAHLADFFRTRLPAWKLEFQNSTSQTPVSGGHEVPFVNLIASRDPPGAPPGEVGRLTLVAHYDSKYEPAGFVGAIDSAAPCAMILHAVRSIDAALTSKWAAMQSASASASASASLDGHTGIQVIFLDGEEAFKVWTASDSLYGARSLAELWDRTMHPAMSTYKTPLSSISLFVLLDLLGAQNPTIQSYYPTTHWAYRRLATLEQRLDDLQLLRSRQNQRQQNQQQQRQQRQHRWFIDASKTEHELAPRGGIEDDHLPFLARGVEVLHLIDAAPTTGFPKVWHTMDDDGEHLHMDTVEDWSVLVAAFAAEWMELDDDLAVLSRQNRSHAATAPAYRKTEL